jgi:hypothetical protein
MKTDTIYFLTLTACPAFTKGAEKEKKLETIFNGNTPSGWYAVASEYSSHRKANRGFIVRTGTTKDHPTLYSMTKTSKTLISKIEGWL